MSPATVSLPLPMDLASVAWLAEYRAANDFLGYETIRARYDAERRRAREVAELRRVVRDQQRHILSLEEQLLPNLVRPVTEQAEML